MESPSHDALAGDVFGGVQGARATGERWGCVSAVARELRMSGQTLGNWIKAAETGKLSGCWAEGGHAGTNGTLALEIAEQAPEMELEIAKKPTTAFFAKELL
jgi:transposase